MLPAPPEKALDALEIAAQNDPDTASWVDALEKHYEALDACGQR